MTLLGWNDASLDSVTEIDFKSSPWWLQFLALTPVVEKYAYPIAVRRGFATIWISNDLVVDIDVYLAQGWKVKIGEPDDSQRFLSGSLAKLSIDSKSARKPIIKFTRLGRELAWKKAIHESNGTLNYLEEGSSPFDKQ